MHARKMATLRTVKQEIIDLDDEPVPQAQNGTNNKVVPEKSVDDDICELEHLRKLFIGGLAPFTTEASLKDFYGQWGNVVDVVVMRDTATRRSRGFGFITYTKSSSVDKAQDNRPHIIDGKSVEAKRALPRPEREARETNITVKKLFVGGLKDNHDEDCLKEYFSQFGKVVSVKILTDKTTGKRRGFAFIEYDDYDAVDKAILQKTHSIKYVVVDVKKSVYKQEQQHRQQSENAGGAAKLDGKISGARMNGGQPPQGYRPAQNPPYQQPPPPMNTYQPPPPPNYNYWNQQAPPGMPGYQQPGGYQQPAQPPPQMNNWGYNTPPMPPNAWNARPPPPGAPIPPPNWQQQPQPQQQWYGGPPAAAPRPRGLPPVPSGPSIMQPTAPPAGPPPAVPMPPNFGAGYQQNYGGGPTKHNSNTNRMAPYNAPPTNNYASQPPANGYGNYNVGAPNIQGGGNKDLRLNPMANNAAVAAGTGNNYRR